MGHVARGSLLSCSCDDVACIMRCSAQRCFKLPVPRAHCLETLPPCSAGNASPSPAASWGCCRAQRCVVLRKKSMARKTAWLVARPPVAARRLTRPNACGAVVCCRARRCEFAVRHATAGVPRASRSGLAVCDDAARTVARRRDAQPGPRCMPSSQTRSILRRERLLCPAVCRRPTSLLDRCQRCSLAPPRATLRGCRAQSRISRCARLALSVSLATTRPTPLRCAAVQVIPRRVPNSQTVVLILHQRRLVARPSAVAPRLVCPSPAASQGVVAREVATSLRAVRRRVSRVSLRSCCWWRCRAQLRYTAMSKDDCAAYQKRNLLLKFSRAMLCCPGRPLLPHALLARRPLRHKALPGATW